MLHIGIVGEIVSWYNSGLHSLRYSASSLTTTDFLAVNVDVGCLTPEMEVIRTSVTIEDNFFLLHLLGF